MSQKTGLLLYFQIAPATLIHYFC